MARIFVGIAWPYANGPFHIGHLAGAYLPGDAFARFHRLRGDEVLMVSGSDMHGTPVLVTAERDGTTPESVARRFHEVNRDAFERLGFGFDCYTDTHTFLHERTVQEIFLQLLEQGFVDRRTEENAYCPTHARFLPDRYVVGICPHCGFEEARGDECDRCGRFLEPGSVGSPRCLLCGTSAERRPSEHFYLKLDRLTPEISGFLSGNPDWRPNVAKVAANFLKEGLHATPITRDLNWGVPIPLEGYESKRFYVWFDAVIGYLSASKEWAIRHGDPAAWERFWTPSDDLRPYYFIGKDNIFHHTVLWPGVLLAVGNLALPRDVPANEWLVVGGKKLAKSRSGDRDAFVPSLLEGYAPDHIRFYAALLAPQNHDTEFDWDEFHRVHDEILANQYGNLVQRLLVLARDRDSGRVPTPPEATLSGSEGVGERIRLAHERITGEFEKVHLKEALELALAEIREGNRRFHEAKPWQADEADRRRAVGEGLWLIQAAAVWLSPFLPFSSSEVWRMLGRTGPPGPGDWDAVLTPPVPGTRLGEPRPLFPKRERPRGAPTGAAPPPVETAAPSAEVPLDVRAAKVLEAAAHPSADRLLVLTLDIGEERPRTVVAGIRRYYRPEELAGRRISLLSNLEPRTIRGVVSQGMILTVEGTERVELLEPPEGVGPGTPIEGTVPGTPPITHDDFSRVELVVGQVVGSAGEGGSRVDLGGREVEVPGRWIDGALVAVRVDRPGGLRGRVLAFGPGAPLGPPALVVPGTRIR